MKIVLLIFFYLGCIVHARSQDAHYWTEQYGTKSILLSGSNIGSVEDLGAVYYNPARLSLNEDEIFLISGKVYQLSSYSFHNKTGNDRTSPRSQSNFGGAPSLLAGTYRIKGLKKHSFAYSFMSRRRMDLNLNESGSTYGNSFPSIPGNEYLSGDIGMQKKFNEEWLGLSWAYAFNDHFSVGISNFLSIRKQSASEMIQIQAYTEAEKLESYSNKNSYNFSHIGILWKIGLAWEHNAFSWGLTITTPTQSLQGIGSFSYYQHYTGALDDKAIYERNTQSDIEVQYQTPFAIATGIGLKTKFGTFHASTEYYSAIKKYTLMKSDEFTGQSSGTLYQTSLIDELNPVLNFGIGYNYVFNNAIQAYLSYSSDFSGSVTDINNSSVTISESYASTISSDINHLGGGIVLSFKRANLTLGTTLATTKYTVNRPFSFPEENGRGISSSDNQTDIRWNRWRFIVGISVPFLHDWTKKIKSKVLDK
ncbi:hypothetical protein [Labilibacter marinus]|uniref:hypothetical protein n=1 Tax=Labilibacter marinus TaxID=1477105 RepID=UPI000831C858|nr:hypothetical protein [Labilibacter marinus]